MSRPVAIIIEDQINISQLYSDALSLAGYDTHAVLDGSKAIEALATITPNVIVLDMNLPHVSGHYILKFIRGEDRLKNIPVIIATANSIMAQAVASEMTERDFILIKPVSMKDLNILAKKLKDSPAEKPQEDSGGQK